MTQTIPQFSISPNASVSLHRSNGLCSPMAIRTPIFPSAEISTFFARYQTLMATIYAMDDSKHIQYTAPDTWCDAKDGEHLACYTTGIDNLVIVQSGVQLQDGDSDEVHQIFGMYFLDTGILYTLDYITYNECNKLLHSTMGGIRGLTYDESRVIEEMFEFLNDYYAHED
jgi:hypothetical protein